MLSAGRHRFAILGLVLTACLGRRDPEGPTPFRTSGAGAVERALLRVAAVGPVDVEENAVISIAGEGFQPGAPVKLRFEGTLSAFSIGAHNGSSVRRVFEVDAQAIREDLVEWNVRRSDVAQVGTLGNFHGRMRVTLCGKSGMCAHGTSNAKLAFHGTTAASPTPRDADDTAVRRADFETGLAIFVMLVLVAWLAQRHNRLPDAPWKEAAARSADDARARVYGLTGNLLLAGVASVIACVHEAGVTALGIVTCVLIAASHDFRDRTRSILVPFIGIVATLAVVIGQQVTASDDPMGILEVYVLRTWGGPLALVAIICCVVAPTANPQKRQLAAAVPILASVLIARSFVPTGLGRPIAMLATGLGTVAVMVLTRSVAREPGRWILFACACGAALACAAPWVGFAPRVVAVVQGVAMVTVSLWHYGSSASVGSQTRVNQPPEATSRIATSVG